MTEFTVTATDVIEMVLWLVVAMVIAVLVYRGMQRPRLRLVPTDAGWRTTVRDVVLYVATAPLMVTAWFFFFVTILVIGTNDLTGDRIIVVAMAVVIASRVFAHVWHEAAHELAKTVPLTLVALILIAGGLRSDTSLETIGTELDETGISGPALLMLLFVDYVFTLAWYWIGVRWWHRRGHRVPGVPRPAGATP